MVLALKIVLTYCVKISTERVSATLNLMQGITYFCFSDRLTIFSSERVNFLMLSVKMLIQESLTLYRRVVFLHPFKMDTPL